MLLSWYKIIILNESEDRLLKKIIDEVVAAINDIWISRSGRIILKVDSEIRENLIHLDVRLKTPDVDLTISANVDLSKVREIDRRHIIAAAILLAITTYTADVSAVMRTARIILRIRNGYDFTEDWQTRVEAPYKYIGVSLRYEQSAKDIQGYLDLIARHRLPQACLRIPSAREYRFTLAYKEGDRSDYRRRVEVNIADPGIGILQYKMPLVPMTAAKTRYDSIELTAAIITYFDEMEAHIQGLIDFAVNAMELQIITIGA